MIRVAEFVGRGHPDSLADILADKIAYLTESYFEIGHSASIEVLLSSETVVVAGEVANLHKLKEKQYKSLIRQIKKEVKNFLDSNSYDSENFKIRIDLKSQGDEINRYSIGEGIRTPGDQSVTYGYACDSWLGLSTYMPEEYDLARMIVNNLRKVEGVFEDAKCLVAIDKITGKRIKLREIFLSVNHDHKLGLKELRQKVYTEAIYPLISKFRASGLNAEGAKIAINPAGSFVEGGLAVDTGATNRKLSARTYGCSVIHGGGGLYGKDLGKVDRLGAYWARFICKNMVASRFLESLTLGIYWRPSRAKPEYFIQDFRVNRRLFEIPPTREIILKVIEEVFGSYEFHDIWTLFSGCFYNWTVMNQEGHFGQEDFKVPWEIVSLDGEIWKAAEKNVLVKVYELKQKET